MFRALLTALAVLASGLTGTPSQATAQGQSQSYPESVVLEPNGNTERVAFPGQTLAFTVQGVDSYTAPLLEVRVPAGLVVEEGYTCNAHALLDPEGAGNQNARPSSLLCTGGITQEADGSSLFRIQTGESYQSVLTYNVFLNFSVTVPEETEPGLLFTITAPRAGLAGSMATSTIEVLNPDGSHAAELKTPTPAGITLVTPPANTTPLMLTPEVVEARAGQVITFQLHIPRSAMWELESFAFLAWAEQSSITNLQNDFLDSNGDAACSAGSTGDQIDARSRLILLEDDSLVPNQIDVRVGEGVQVDQNLQLCIELIGFAGTSELYSWNVYGIIVVVE